jgi:hypothetical protein
MSKKDDKHKGIENPKYAREIAELRRSNAAGIHEDKRTRRARTRLDSNNKAIQEFYNKF